MFFVLDCDITISNIGINQALFSISVGSTSQSGSSKNSLSGDKESKSEHSFEDEPMTLEILDTIAKSITESCNTAEGVGGYRIGGYRQIIPFESALVNKDGLKMYTPIRKLGWGHFSTVWEVYLNDNISQRFAMKVIKSAPQYRQAAKSEIEYLKIVSENDLDNTKHCCHMYDNFEMDATDATDKTNSQKNIFIVFDLLGSNLLSLIKAYKYNGIPVEHVKVITKQVLVGLNFIHKCCGLVHTDLKPENILLDVIIKNNSKTSKEPVQHNEQPQTKKTWFDFTKVKIDNGVMSQLRKVPKALQKTNSQSQEAKVMEPNARRAFLTTTCPSISIEEFNDKHCNVKISDFGNACHVNKIRSGDIQTRQYRSPEVILRRGWDQSADIWSFGCIVFELLTGEYLFAAKEATEMEKDLTQLESMCELMGDFSEDYLKGARRKNVYFTNGKLNKRVNTVHKDFESLMHERLKKVKFQSASDEANCIAFLKQTLKYEGRASAEQLLQDDWLKNVRNV